MGRRREIPGRREISETRSEESPQRDAQKRTKANASEAVGSDVMWTSQFMVSEDNYPGKINFGNACTGHNIDMEFIKDKREPN
ncbi:hypothetical protein HPB50_005737 [Hyalomma asiaticum]|uniref:Uncharacterized protein n=1 Tax=Hyalomma asiaticum TaxID=266040 RepID=A0ACB7SL24_HYAAI|nr:hypothetical protein HPB50_005737 [Hyalomma asiaticum]